MLKSMVERVGARCAQPIKPVCSSSSPRLTSCSSKIILKTNCTRDDEKFVLQRNLYES